MSEQYKKISAIIESLKLYAERKAEIHMDTRESNMKSKVLWRIFVRLLGAFNFNPKHCIASLSKIFYLAGKRHQKIY